MKPVTSSSGLASAPHAELPLDIIIETLVAAFLLCVGIVVGAPGLKPIQWREWAGKLEREGVREDQKLEDRTRNPYRVLEDRQGFLDVRVSASSCALRIGIWAGAEARAILMDYC